MSDLIPEERHKILQTLLDCEADVTKILVKLEELRLHDCVLSLREVAKILHLSKTRIQQIEDKALHKLKQKLEKSI